MPHHRVIKFVFSKKATKFHEIFTVDLTLTTYCQIDGEVFPFFEAFSETMNFKNVYAIYTRFPIVESFGHCGTDFQSCYDFEVLELLF